MAGTLPGGAPVQPYGALRVEQGRYVEIATLTGNITLDDTYPNVLKLDPGGSARDVTLPAVATSKYRTYDVINAADAAENLVVKNAGGSTIVTINQNERAVVWCDGSAWNLLYVATIALS